MPLTAEDLRALVRREWMGELSELANVAVAQMEVGELGGCEVTCGTLLAVLWERLNTGHWRDVDPGWRRLYSLSSLLSACVGLNIPLPQLEDAALGTCPPAAVRTALRRCDFGLLMGAPVLDGALSALAQRLHDALPPLPPLGPPGKRARLAAPPLLSSTAIPRLELPSLEAFTTGFLLPQSPVILTGLVGQWAAFGKWDVDFVRRVAGHRHVPVEVGSRYDAAGWGQRIMPLGDFCQEFMGPDATERGYLAQHELFGQIPALAEDWAIPDYCYLCAEDDDSEVAVNAWFGPGGTVSPLHTDPRANLLAQVFGSKFVRLHDAADADAVYPHTDGILTNTSQVDMENIDIDKFPKMSGIRTWECVLEAGEALYIPRRWWHYLRSLEPSFSISFWFGPPDTQ